MAKVIGITGGIATGKSTVSNMIKELGYTVIDADIIARKVVEPGERAYQEIVDYYGEGILLQSGIIDRKKLGGIVFHSKEKREKLNSIVHPAVRSEMKEEMYLAKQRGETAIFLDIPLLYESKLTYMADQIIVVYADESVQLERLMKRNGLSKEEALARIRSQLSIEEKRKLADYVIDNRFSLDNTKKQLIMILKELEVL